MNSNQTIQQPKPDSKGKAITSLLLGIITVIPVVIILIVRALIGIGQLSSLTMGSAIIAVGVFILIILAVAVLGVIFGIIGLKSTKKNLAIVGIILSSIGLATSIYIYLIALRIGTA